MGPFYRFCIPIGQPVGFVDRVPDADFSLARLLRGAALPATTLPTPCRFTLRPPQRKALELADCYLHVDLMSRRMLEVLHAAGVSNLQTWPAEIAILGSEEILRDYVVFNVVGLVSCADTSASQSTPLAEGSFFMELTLNPGRAAGARMFRLAESPIELIVDSSIADAIAQARLSHVELEALDENE